MLSCGLFAGAAVYINLVEHPARMECGTELAATEFGPSYHRAAIMQASLAVLGFVASIAAWLAERNWGLLLGGVLLVAVVPFTLVVILPTNKKLLDPALDKGSEQARQLLLRWGRLHAVRSILSMLSLLIFLYVIFSDKRDVLLACRAMDFRSIRRGSYMCRYLCGIRLNNPLSTYNRDDEQLPFR